MKEKGLIHIYCGDGRGKTTAAVGLAVRAAGRGLRVLISRFLKTEDSGEVEVLRAIPGITVLPCERTFGFLFRMSPEQKREAARYFQGQFEKTAAMAQDYDLLILLGKSTNVQAVFGQGHTTGGSGASDLLTTGTLNTKGQFYGTSDTLSAVKVFHMENFWGDRWDRIVGLIYENGMYKAKMTPEGNGYNLTGDGYTTIRKGITATQAGGGWVKNAQQTEYGLFPTDLTGSEYTHDCDFHYYNPAIVSVPIVGGDCNNGGLCGRYLHVNNVAGNAGWNIGASLFLNSPS